MRGWVTQKLDGLNSDVHLQTGDMIVIGECDVEQAQRETSVGSHVYVHRLKGKRCL